MATTQEKAVKRPSPGQLVAMYGVPTANNDEAVGGTGRYLGRVSYVQPNGTIQFKDIVGIVTSNVKEDACNFGASGSLFSATIKNKSTGRTRTYISGSLSTRISDNDVAMLDQSDYSSLRGDLGNEIDAVAHWKDEIQQQLGVNVSGFDSLCSYSVNLPHSNKELIEGFKVNAPAFPDQGEGDPVFADGTVGKGGEFIGNK
jgi:hypothetical protein